MLQQTRHPSRDPGSAAYVRTRMTATTPVRRAWWVVACVLALAPLSAGAQAAPVATKRVAGQRVTLARLVRERSADTMRDSIVAMARRQVGTPYVLGAGSPERGFDCSGLVAYVMRQFDLRVPRTAATQAGAGRAVRRQLDALKPGDLLTFGAGSRTSHIGIYVGGGRFVHASTKAGKVVESKLDRPVTREIKPWRGARRLVTVASATPASSSPAVTR